MYFNPAGAEECSAHFITTVIPPATTTVLTISSGNAPITTISGPFIGASTVTPSEVVPTYIVRACYGDVDYRFQSACSCIGVGPTVTTAPTPVATNTVIVPFAAPALPSTRPFITAPPVPLPEPIDVGPGGQPACVAVPFGPVIVTVQVDEIFAMSLTVSGPVLCLAETVPPPPPSSGCNCASSLPSSAPFSSTFAESAVANATSSSSADTFSTVFRTVYTSSSTSISSEGFSNYSSTAEPTSATSASTFSEGFSNFSSTAEPTSAPSEITAPTSEPTPEPTSSSLESSSDFDFSTSSSRSFQPFNTRNSSTESSSTVEPSSTEFSSTTEPSSVEASSTETASSSPTPFAPFVPNGPEIFIRVSAGTFIGQYIATDEPSGSVLTNLKSHTTTELELAAVWTLDATTGILFQQIGGAWFGAYFTFGARAQWSSVLLLPADTVVGWLTAPVVLREPLRCVIDYSANMLLTCGAHGWTDLTESDKCGWAITTPLNPFHALACPNAQELLFQAIEVNPQDEGISKKKKKN